MNIRSGVLLIHLLIQNFGYSQKTNSLQFFASPFIQKIGNLNKQYTEVANEFIAVDYLKVPSKEFGIEYHHKFQGKFGYSVGFSWANSGTKSITSFYHSEDPEFTLDVQYKTLQYSSVGLRLGCSYHFLDRIKLHAYCNIQLPYTETLNTYWLTHYGLGSKHFFNYDIRIITGGTVGSAPDIIPELRAGYEIFPQLYFFTGMRLKFWDFADDYTMKVEVTGFTGEENYGTDKVLHLSKAKGTDVSYYFGLMYDLPLINKKKR